MTLTIIFFVLLVQLEEEYVALIREHLRYKLGSVYIQTYSSKRHLLVLT